MVLDDIRKREITEQLAAYCKNQPDGFRLRLSAYTDGSAHSRLEPHTGGWSYILLEGDKDLDSLCLDDIIAFDFGGGINVTNNIEELTGVLKVIEILPPHCDIVIFSDSSYVGVSLSDNGKPKTNLDLIFQIKKLVWQKDLKVKIQWIHGHNTSYWNNFADALAVAGTASADVMYKLSY